MRRRADSWLTKTAGTTDFTNLFQVSAFRPSPYVHQPVQAPAGPVPLAGYNFTKGRYSDIDRDRGTYKYTDATGTTTDIDLLNDPPFTRNLKAMGTIRGGTYSRMYGRAVGDPDGWKKKMRYWSTGPSADWNKVYRDIPSYVRSSLPGLRTVRPPAEDFGNTRATQTHIPEFGNTGVVYNVSKASGTGDFWYATPGSPRLLGNAYGAPFYNAVNIPTSDELKYPQQEPSNSEFSEYAGVWHPSAYSIPLKCTATPQPVAAFHEITHANTVNAAGSPGAPVMRDTYGQGWEWGDAWEPYSVIPGEVLQGVTALNTGYQALLNDMAASPGRYPEDVRALVQAYPAYGTREQFMARNDMLLANPGLTQKYLGSEPVRALAGYSYIKGRMAGPAERVSTWTDRDESEYRRLSRLDAGSMTERQRAAYQQLRDRRENNMRYNYWKKRAETFNDAYFADRRAQGGTAQA